MTAKARNDLKQYLSHNSEADQLKRLEILPSHIAEIGQKLIQSTHIDWYETDNTAHQPWQCKINKLNNLDASDRLLLFLALFPGIASEVDSTYSYFSQLSQLTAERHPSFTHEHKETHLTSNTTWLIFFTAEIKGFEEQNINWFIEYERYFRIWYILSALIAKDDEIGNQILGKVLSIPFPKSNVLNIFLCVPLNIGRRYLEENIDKYYDESVDRFHIYCSPVHPQAICYAYNYAEDKNYTKYGVHTFLNKYNDFTWEPLVNSQIPENEKNYTKLLNELASCLRLNRFSNRHQPVNAEKVIEYITRPDLVEYAIQTGGNDDTFHALYATAFQNQELAIQYVDQVINAGKADQLNAAIKILTSLTTVEVIPLLVQCVREANPNILKQIYSYQYNNCHDPCTGFDRYLNCYQDQIAQTDLFECMEKIYLANPDIIPDPHEFIKYLGNRSIKRLDFLGEMTGDSLSEIACNQASKNHKNNETVEFLVSVALKCEATNYEINNWNLQPNEDTRIKALEGLQDVDLTIDQYLEINDGEPGDSEILQAKIISLLFSREDAVIEKMLLKGCISKERLVRLRVMRLMDELKKANRLSTLIPEYIKILRSNTNLTEDETFFIKTFLEGVTQSDARKIDLFFYYVLRLGNNSFFLGKKGSKRLSEIGEKIRNFKPGKDDTFVEFKVLAEEHNISSKRLVELAFFSPAWLKYIDFTLGWEGFLSAYAWFWYHHKNSTYSDWNPGRFSHIDKHKDDYKDPINISEFNKLGYWDVHGIEDMDWFHKAYDALGEEKWNIVKEASNCASIAWSKRAHYISDAATGKLSSDELIKRIPVNREIKGHLRARNLVTALSVIPLGNEPERTQELLKRYQVLNDFLRNSKNYGKIRREGNESYGKSALINLSINAGYSSYEDFEFAMETASLKDFAEGAVIKEVNGYKLILRLAQSGKPQLEIFKGDSLLRSVPKSLIEVEGYKSFKERLRQLNRQVSRKRKYLEDSMSTEKVYSMVAFKGLMGNPILRPMMDNLVFITDKGMGYPSTNADKLISYDDQDIHLDDNDQLRIAHTYDLFNTGKWSEWQHECFVSGRIQPFKQVFRELYLVTDAEKNEEHESQRFSGQQVDLSHAVALFDARHWYYDDYLRISKGGSNCSSHTSLILTDPYESLDVVLMSHTCTCPFDSVMFYDSKGEKVPLEHVSPIFFSETMRDIDLVVSVAHVKESPWASSASTIENRAALVRETTQLLHLENVKIEDHFALVDGTLASYKVHLGSGSIHQVPGNYVCVIPDNTKFTGKLFLPFIDKDEVTSIVLSKIILLARDEKIKDPVILSQIKRVHE
jgi:hypothetical protein